MATVRGYFEAEDREGNLELEESGDDSSEDSSDGEADAREELREQDLKGVGSVLAKGTKEALVLFLDSRPIQAGQQLLSRYDIDTAVMPDEGKRVRTKVTAIIGKDGLVPSLLPQLLKEPIELRNDVPEAVARLLDAGEVYAEKDDIHMAIETIIFAFQTWLSPESTPASARGVRLTRNVPHAKPLSGGVMEAAMDDEKQYMFWTLMAGMLQVDGDKKEGLQASLRALAAAFSDESDVFRRARALGDTAGAI
uniref:Uncharacterized protein n=1 Tax=Palpitomonas bilix TaxID=652834 RepID=A0A7S3LVH2_9EUKA|mmetsp:Transcript_49775/g.128059  ORF Transcript_49775/g.128059 Transcript_49775/m.128059 type:complete len:252 (+) Transcript_49775:43-798(+)